MYQCFKCGQLYEADGKTKWKDKPGQVLAVFAVIWDCPVCTAREKFEQRRLTLDKVMD